MLLESTWKKLHRLCSQKKSLIPLCAQFKENYNYRNPKDDAHGNRRLTLLALLLVTGFDVKSLLR